MTKLRIVCAAAVLAATASGTAHADASANIGYMSDYIFRGFYQASSVGFAGIDIEADSGFYLGAWGANVKDGLEYDIYLGYARGSENLNWYAGLTGYYYTDGFDKTYEEFNLGFTFGFLSIDYALGDYHYDADSYPSWDMTWKKLQTYQYVGATFAPQVGPYYFLGRTDYSDIGRVNNPSTADRVAGTGSDGYWVEIGKSFEIMEDLELNIAALYSFDIPQPPKTSYSSIQLGPPCPYMDPTCTSDKAEYALVFSLTKTIRLNSN